MATTKERFDQKYKVEAQSGCWIWTAGRYTAGYGQFRLPRARANTPAHRVAWQIYRGPIPDGLHVCHRCDVPSCVNPEHLFLGTPKDNIRDMIAKGRKHWESRKTHCKNGHAFTQENTFIKGNGTQGCKRCRSDAQLRYKARNLDAVRAYQRDRARRIRGEL